MHLNHLFRSHSKLQLFALTLYQSNMHSSLVFCSFSNKSFPLAWHITQCVLVNLHFLLLYTSITKYLKKPYIINWGKIEIIITKMGSWFIHLPISRIFNTRMRWWTMMFQTLLECLFYFYFYVANFSCNFERHLKSYRNPLSNFLQCSLRVSLSRQVKSSSKHEYNLVP